MINPLTVIGVLIAGVWAFTLALFLAWLTIHRVSNILVKHYVMQCFNEDAHKLIDEYVRAHGQVS